MGAPAQSQQELKVRGGQVPRLGSREALCRLTAGGEHK